MVESLVIENFLSIKNRIELSFEAKSITEFPQNLINREYLKNSFVKSIGLFGKNAGGKSNILKAFKVLRDLLLTPLSINSEKVIGIQPFALSTNSFSKPSIIEIVLWIDKDRYRYGFSAFEDKIKGEWLYLKSSQKESFIFIRESSEFRISKAYNKTLSKLVDFVKSNVLFLSVASQFNFQIAKLITGWFSQCQINFQNNLLLSVQEAAQILQDSRYRLQLEKLLDSFDLDIQKLAIKNDAGHYRIISSHDVYDNDVVVDTIDFDILENESTGTIRLICILSSIIKGIADGSFVVIDEFDAGIHFELGKEIINFFINTFSNDQNSQLLFVSHNKNFIDNIRRDQVVIVNKSKTGITTLKRLHEHNLRKDKKASRSFEKGEIGGIPHIKQKQLYLDL